MTVPFSAEQFDELLTEAGIDVVLATSPFNARYLLGGYEFFFFAHNAAIGLGRYLPVVGYRRDHRDDAFYVGAGNEAWGTDVSDLWVGEIRNESWTSVRSAEIAAELLRARGLERATIGIEPSFLPADAWEALRTALPEASFESAVIPLEALRAVKRPEELELIADASERIIASFVATFSQVTPGMTKREIADVLRGEELRVGLEFDYALVTCAHDDNRAPTDRVTWKPGDVLSLDSGATLEGYIGDLARVGVADDPTPRQVAVLEEVERLQQTARSAVRAGQPGGDVYRVAGAALEESPFRDELVFVAHGMGLIPHEAPRLSGTGEIPYEGAHADTPLQAGMVLSIETHSRHPDSGFIKLEDTVIVTDQGWTVPGDTERGFHRCGAQVPA